MSHYIYTRKPRGVRKCVPHDWVIPRAGDQALECEACSRYLPFAHITPAMRVSILRGKAADFLCAFAAASGRVETTPPHTPGPGVWTTLDP